MATTCTSQQMKPSGITVPKRQPRDERLRIPRKNLQSTPTKAIKRPSVDLPRGPPSSPRVSSESSQCPSPKIVESQASSGAEGRRPDDRRLWQGHDLRKLSHETPRRGRQSEVSNVLEYYLRDHSPLQGSTLSPRANLRPGKSAVAAFDFGLDDSTPVCQPLRPRKASAPAMSNISKPPTDKALPAMPSQQTPTYSLFPASTQGPSMDRARCLPTNINANSSFGPSPLGASTDPTRPRKASLPSSIRSRADSCTSIRLLPSAKISPGGAGPPLPGNYPRRPLPIRVSACIPTSPTSGQSTRVSTPTTSRWSGDTITQSLDSSSVKERSSTSSSASSPWPQTGSFFEDDDDEEVPLRQKFTTKIRGARAWSASSTTMSETTTVTGAKKQRGWFGKWVLCCAGGRRG